MSQSANVRSIQAIRDFKAALATFAEDARNALSSSEMEVRRTRDWLNRDQLVYWQTQVKRRNEELSMARTELHRRRLSQQGSDAISDTEQKENLRIAQRRVTEAEEKVKLVKKWVPVLEHAIAEYHSTSQPLGDRLTGALVNSLSLLGRMINTLESYVATAPPSVELSMGALAPDAAPASAAAAAATASGDEADAPDTPAAATGDAPAAVAEEDAEADGQEAHSEPTNRGPQS
jgi:hypothetical protein